MTESEGCEKRDDRKRISGTDADGVRPSPGAATVNRLTAVDFTK